MSNGFSQFFGIFSPFFHGFHLIRFSGGAEKSKNPRVSPGAFEKRREEMKSTAACRFALHLYHSGQL